MLRVLLAAAALALFVVGGALAKDQNNASQNQHGTSGKGQKAKITHVDPQKGTVTVEMPDENGKETTRTFHLTEDVRMLDSNGRVAGMDIFRSGDYVLVVEEQGKLKELHKSLHQGQGPNEGNQGGNQEKGGGGHH